MADPVARQADDPVHWRIAWDPANTLIGGAVKYGLYLRLKDETLLLIFSTRMMSPVGMATRSAVMFR